MDDLRVLTDAELDIVGGGQFAGAEPKPTGVNLVVELIVDILRLLEPKQTQVAALKDNKR